MHAGMLVGDGRPETAVGRLSSTPVRFELRHPFAATPGEVAEAMLDPDFQATLTDIGDLHDRVVLSLETAPDGGITRRVRCVLALDVSGMAKTVLGNADPAWVQEEKWDAGRTHCEWTIHPEVAAELLSAAGTITIEDPDGSEGKSVRTVTGDVRVRVPLYGGKVEGWIVTGVTRAYDEEAERLAAWLEREK